MKETPIHQYLKDLNNDAGTIYGILQNYEVYRLKIEEKEKENNPNVSAKDRAENWREIVEKMIYGIFPENDIRECDEDVVYDFCEYLDIPYDLKWFIPR